MVSFADAFCSPAQLSKCIAIYTLLRLPAGAAPYGGKRGHASNHCWTLAPTPPPSYAWLCFHNVHTRIRARQCHVAVVTAPCPHTGKLHAHSHSLGANAHAAHSENAIERHRPFSGLLFWRNLVFLSLQICLGTLAQQAVAHEPNEGQRFLPPAQSACECRMHASGA